MDLFGIFRTDHNGIRRSHIKNLISVAMVDGHLDPDEWDLLTSIAKVLGMSDQEIVHIKNHPESVSFVPPKKYEEKVEQIHDLVAIMTIDGEINARELDLCKKISLKLDILPQVVDQILQNVFPADPKTD
jgi:uncharacterized tellurite resistance protein B-like protein